MQYGEFKTAPMDIMAKVITILMIVTAGVLPFIPEMVMITVVVLPFVLFVTWLFSVTGYTLKEEYLIVSRPLWKTKITLPPGAKARLEPEVKERLIKTFGNGGLFGYTGSFRNKILGNFKMYGTCWTHAVSITGGSEEFKIVISPENPELFVQSFNG